MIIAVLILILILVHLQPPKTVKKGRVAVRAQSGKEYYVLDSPQKQYVADMLDKVSHKIEKLVELLPSDNAIHTKFSGTLEESAPMMGQKFMGYTVNKGQRIALCVEPKTDENTLMFIAIHELAHVMTDEYDHNEQFWNNMKTLLKIAEENGLYTYYDYSKEPVEFCGKRIESTPL